VSEVLVIGAGPAGLAAAVQASRAGATVTVLDSSDEVGGQYWRHLPPSRPAERERILHHGWQKFEKLRAELETDPRVTVLRLAQVWAIDRPDDRWRVHVLQGPADGVDREAITIEPETIVLATGAHDRTLPFPGWQLPGVFSAGAAQALAKGERVAVGSRVVVSGAGPFLLPVAASLAQVGATVLGVHEASRLSRLAAGWLPRPWQLVGARAKAGELIGYARNHVRHRIPYRTGSAVVAAQGEGRVEHVVVAELDANWSPIAGTERTIEADAVCVGHGFTPRLELAIAIGCALSPERFVEIDSEQATTVPGVYAAGEITGIGGVDAALAEGAIAGHCAAGGSSLDAGLRPQLARRRSYTGFAARIEAAHGIRPGWSEWLKDETLVCRCEEVSHGRLKSTVRLTGSAGLRSLKLSTRAGLGICQGRVCGRTVEDLLTRQLPQGLIDGVSTDRRPIVSPVRLGELAAGQNDSGSPGQTRTPSERKSQ
jgi:NADPH-dependent 2,4-dienoyl-CoA reductase/sulfur reductase-like enzyme